MSNTLKLECLDNSGNDLFLVDSNIGVSIKKTTNAIGLGTGGALTVDGGASFIGDVYCGRLNTDQFSMTNIVTGVSTLYSATFNAANNISTPTNVTGLSFDNSDIRNFVAQMTVSILRSSGGNLFETFNIEGMQNDSGWTLYTSSVGDTSGITFSITSTGQIRYTSTNITNWSSSTFRYLVTKISNTGTYESLQNSTIGAYSFDSILINNTTGAILGSENGSLYSLGGASFEKNIIIKSTNNATGIGSGGSLTVLGGTSISSNLLVGTGITTSNINFTGDLYKNGVLYTGSSQWTDFSGNVIAYTKGNVGINTTNPTTTLDVNGTIDATTYTGGSMSLSGAIRTTTNSEHQIISVTGGSYMYMNTVSTSNTSGFGRIGVWNSNVSGDGSQHLVLQPVGTSGNVGIGTSAPTYKLHVSGDIYATGDITALSDMRRKTDIVTIDEALDKVEQLRGVYFKSLVNERKNVGVIAQEIETVLPEVVLTDSEGYKSVAYGNMVGILIEAIKELSTEVKYLKRKLSENE
jgi:hypothetical protein